MTKLYYWLFPSDCSDQYNSAGYSHSGLLEPEKPGGCGEGGSTSGTASLPGHAASRSGITSKPETADIAALHLLVAAVALNVVVPA